MAHTRLLINKPTASIPIKPGSAIANGNRFVKFDSDAMSVVLCSASTDDADGVIDHPFAAAELGEMSIHGVVLVEAGASVAPGNYVMADTSARAIVATTGKPVLGKCVAAIGTVAAGDLISIDLDDKQSVAP